MTTRLTPAEINRVGEALVGGDLVTELEAIVDERVEFITRDASDLSVGLAELAEWSNELAVLIPDGDESRFANPEGARESIISDCFKTYVAQLERVRAYAQQLWDSASADDRLVAEELERILEIRS